MDSPYFASYKESALPVGNGLVASGLILPEQDAIAGIVGARLGFDLVEVSSQQKCRPLIVFNMQRTDTVDGRQLRRHRQLFHPEPSVPVIPSHTAGQRPGFHMDTFIQLLIAE